MDTKAILAPNCDPSSSCTCAILAVSKGQVSWQEVKMKVTATTLPR
jgi:hypothetical protein